MTTPIRPVVPTTTPPVRDWRLDEGGPLARAQQVSAGQDAAQAAKVLELSKRTGMTPAFVKDNYEVLEREASASTFDAREFSQKSPIVADWLAADPNRLALMGRDLTRMGYVERMARDVVARFQQGRRQTELLRIGEAALQGTITATQRERQRFLEAQRTEDFGLEGFFEGAPGAAAEQLPILARTLTAGGVGAFLGATVGGATGAIAGKSPAAISTGAKFGMGVGAGTAVAYDVAVMEASGAMLDYERIEGLDPETARGAALLAGALSGSLEAISLKQLAKVTPGLRDLGRSGVRSLLTNPSTRDLFLRTAKAVGLSAATEGATETLQSLITQGGGTIAEAAESGRLESDLAGVLGEAFGPEARAQALAEGRVGAQAGLLLASVGGAGSLTQDVVRARRAERQAETIAKLADAGADAEVTATAPDEVAAMVTELRQAGLSGFSYDAQTWTTFWQSAKDEQGGAVDPAKVAAEVLGDLTAYQSALATGGTFEVPLGPWLTKLARNPAVREWAVQNARVGPGEMSAAEAAISAEQTEKVLESLVEQAVTSKAEAVPVDEAAASLAARVEQEVRKAGRPVREAKRAGLLWGEVYKTWAATSGTSAEDLAAMFANVRIGEQAPEGGTALEQAAFHGTPHIFDKFTTAKMGTGEGAQAYGWGLYFAENQNVAEGYSKTLGAGVFRYDGVAITGESPRRSAVELLWSWQGDVAGALDDAKLYDDAKAVQREIRSLDYSKIETGGALYRVDIPDAVVATFLDWDKPLSEQAPEVREAFRRVREAVEGENRLPPSILAMTGETLYKSIGFAVREKRRAETTSGWTSVGRDTEDRAWSADEAASKALLAAGIRGIKFLDAGSRSAGDGTRNLVVFDENDITITHRNGEPVTAAERATVLEQGGDTSPRGRIRFTEDRSKAHIELFEAADASTFLHESAHLFLSLMGQLAASPNATDRVKADYAGALAWLGATDGQPLTVEQEEQFARGFEAYLMEGKAPSQTLRSAFAAFANWLTALYRSIRGLNVELTPEIRAIFDRMLATDAAIQEATESGIREPVFLGSDEVMPPAEAARYAEAIMRANEAATEALRTDVLAVIAREEKAWFKARAAEIEPEVRAEVYADPPYRARAIFQTGAMPDGTALPDGDPLLGRLSKDGVVQLIGTEGAKALPKPVMYRVDGGVHPDVAATALDFENGTALLAALNATIPIEKEIRRRVDARLREEYGDPLTDGTMAARAVDAIHTAERDRVIQLELEEMQRRDPAAVRGLLRRFGGRIPVTADLMQQADAMLMGRTLRSIRPVEFQRAEVKAAKDAIAAAVKGDWAVAAEAKIRERLSLALYRAAVASRIEVEKAETRFARYFRPDDVLAKTRDMNLVNAARASLARVGIGRAGKTADEYLKLVRQYDAETADDLDALVDTNVPPREDSRDLTLAEFRQVDAQATALWEQAKRTRQMVIDGKRLDRTAIVDALGAELATMPDRMKGAGQKAAMTTGETIRRRLLGAEAALRRVESWVDQMDGGNINGIFRRYLWTPISEASAAFRVAKRDVTNQYLAILQQIPAARLTEGPFAAPEIGYTFRDRQELLGAMLHTGNLSNKDKLLRGRGWDVSQWDAMVRRMQNARILDASDYTFLQAVWDLFESLKPEAQRVHKEMLGVYFDEITAAEVVTPFGTYRGGYVPAMADTMLSEDARIRGERAEQEGVNPSTMFPNVQRGFTKGRVDEYARPLLMDLRLIRTHIDAVTRFIHLGMPTRDLGRLLLDRRFRGALSAVDPEMGSELVAWAQRAGSQVIETPSRGGGGKTADTIFKWFRSTAGLNLMALNVTNTLQQFTGLSIGAVKVPPAYLRNALWQVTRQPKQTAAAIADLSPYMATRVTTSVMDVERRIDALVTNPTKYEQAKAFAKEHGYILQSATQGLVDSVVWQGAFDWATANGADQTMAVRQADAAVRLTQGSFAPEDVSRFETGSPFVRAFTMFYSYFNMQANLLRAEFAQEMRKSGLRKGAGRMLYVYALGFMVPAVLSQAIIEALNGSGDDDDEGELSDWMAVFFGAQVRTAFALVPGGNVVVQAGINQFNDKWYDDRVSVSPAVVTIESAGRGTKALYDWWADGEVQRRDVRDVLTLLSLTSGFPFAALSRPGSYLFDVQQGTAEPTGPVDFTRGLVSGRP